MPFLSPMTVQMNKAWPLAEFHGTRRAWPWTEAEDAEILPRVKQKRLRIPLLVTQKRLAAVGSV